MNDTTLPRASIARSERIVFTGERRDFFRLVRRGALLELVTAGFYRFWLATDIRSALWSGTSIDGHGLEYTGTAKELLIGFLFALAILAPIYLIYFLIGIEAERAKAFASIPLILFFYAFSQFAIFRARRYRATRTVWRGARLWMSGSGWAYSWRACLWSLLTLLTLGLALPWRESALERYNMRHLHYGDLAARFEGTGWGLFKRAWWLWLLSLPIVTLPWTYPAYKAVLWRWWISGIRFGDVGFESDLRAGGLMGLYWAVFGWVVFLVMADLVLIAIATIAAALFPHLPHPLGADVVLRYSLLHPYLTVGTTILRYSLLHPYLTVGASIANYLVLVLCFGVIVRVYLMRGVWQRVVTSVTVHNLDHADDVRVRGAPASALGEGFADSLDVAGF
jgi:uncharacterized membrane protein YjgN (DUF898 family)